MNSGSDDAFVLPGAEDELGAAPPPPATAQAGLPLPTPSGSEPRPAPALGGSARIVERRRGGLRLRSSLCLAGLLAACHYTRPREASLVAALDSYHQEWGHLLSGGAEMLGESAPELIDAGWACLATHGDLIWLGVLGRWLPLVPLSSDALGAWAAAAGAPQLLLLALTLGYVLGKVAASQLAVSFDAIFRRARLHTLATSALFPVGLVHWLHALCVVVVGTDGLGELTPTRTQALSLALALALALTVVGTDGRGEAHGARRELVWWWRTLTLTLTLSQARRSAGGANWLVGGWRAARAAPRACSSARPFLDGAPNSDRQ